MQKLGPRYKRTQFCCSVYDFYFGESCCCRDRKGQLVHSTNLVMNHYEFSILTIVNPDCVKHKCPYGWKCPYME
ncbi:hypothetical protein BpHYR1_000555 [Brachionus plicatilis]|uniref:Uncharacterized protein n=1 Tax=Brachionus plicatilis TaxID=10195 RepID=A0A3M7R4V9_BRAPC|nr:hypothetical protein BpHYR1_000555 [Brachionus plicatilis]